MKLFSGELLVTSEDLKMLDDPNMGGGDILPVRFKIVSAEEVDDHALMIEFEAVEDEEGADGT